MKESDRVRRFAKHISAAAKLYGWEVLFPRKEVVPWVIIGEPKEIKRIAKKLRRDK